MIKEMAIKTQCLSKVYDKVAALNSISMEVPVGAICGLIGSNGSGKSTLIQILLGVIRPSSGKCFILSEEVNQHSSYLRKKVAYVPDIPVFYPHFTIQQMYELNKRLYSTWDKKVCNQLHNDLELPFNKRVGTLSRGQKVRLALVIALSIKAQVLILDEPSAGLDPQARKQYLELISAERKKHGMTLFYSTHNLNDLEQTADYIAALNHGELLFSCKYEDLRAMFHCIRVTFRDNIPNELLEYHDIIDVQPSINSSKIICKGNKLSTVIKKLQSYDPLNIEVIDMSLEETYYAAAKQLS